MRSFPSLPPRKRPTVDDSDPRPPRLDPKSARAPPPAAEIRAPPRDSQLLLADPRAPPLGQQRGEVAEPSRSASSTAARAPPLAAVSTGAPRASPPAACGRSLSGSCSGSKRKRKRKRIDFDPDDGQSGHNETES